MGVVIMSMVSHIYEVFSVGTQVFKYYTLVSRTTNHCVFNRTVPHSKGGWQIVTSDGKEAIDLLPEAKEKYMKKATAQFISKFK